MDWSEPPVGPVVDFDGLKRRWMGQGERPAAMANMKPGEMVYKSIQSHRKSTMHFDKGRPVFLLDDLEGTPWVMQAYSGIVDPSITDDSLKDMSPKLKLPDGWKYRVVTLDKDLNITTPGGFAWITQDKCRTRTTLAKKARATSSRNSGMGQLVGAAQFVAGVGSAPEELPWIASSIAPFARGRK